MGCLQKGWTELSFMLSKRCYVATTIFQSRCVHCTAFREFIPIMYSFIQRLVALGGHDGITRLKSAEIYDPGWELDFYEVDEIPL